MMSSFFFLCLFMSYCADMYASEIRFTTRSAVVWSPAQTISGYFDGGSKRKLTVHCNNKLLVHHTNYKGAFSFEIILEDSISHIWIESNISNITQHSDTLTLVLGYKPKPVVLPYAKIKGEEVNLHAFVLENPYNRNLSYSWQQADSLQKCVIKNANTSNATAKLPDEEHAYYFSLRVIAEKDTCWFKTYVIKNKSGIRAFSLNTDHAAWIDDAIIYQVTPSAFVAHGTLNDVTNKLVEIKQLGVNTILLQPVFKTYKGFQGYDVTDFFSVRPDIGTEGDLSKLVALAHKMGMKVMLDLVPNHTSIHHPYAKDCAAFKEQSHYYAFYQHQKDNKPYSSHYNADSAGFIYYFWKDLVNLNYDNPEVQQWMTQVCLYWLEKFDIDGYRFDAVWAVNARNPSFAKKLRAVLKSVKPDFFMLAEDKASDPSVYSLGFDAAYDWTTDTSWVSQWSWQTKFDRKKNLTVFNDTDRFISKQQLEHSIFVKPNGLVVRFLENNDLPRFIVAHETGRTKMAAALLFSLPGIPLLYNGQETGRSNHPYSSKNIYNRDSTIMSYDTQGLFNYYQKLIRLRQQYAVIKSGNLRNVAADTGLSVTALYKKTGNEECLVIINLDSTNRQAKVQNIFNSDDSVSFTNLLTGEKIQCDSKPVITISMNGYSVKWLLKNKDKHATDIKN